MGPKSSIPLDKASTLRLQIKNKKRHVRHLRTRKKVEGKHAKKAVKLDEKMFYPQN